MTYFLSTSDIGVNTGILRQKRPIKAVSILKEDRQAFGLLVAKALTLEEAFTYPITSVPLSIATQRASLGSQTKHP